MNEQYMFWNIDSTNWDSAYIKYQPLFAALDITKQQDNDSAYSYIKKMTLHMVDSHLTITFYNSFLQSMTPISPAQERYATAFGSHPAIPGAFFYQTIPNNYLDPGSMAMMSNSPDVTNGNTLRLVTGTIKSKILYFSFNDFYLRALDNSNDPSRAVIDTFISRVRNLSPSIKGIILDLRSNNGGAVIDLDFLAGNFLGTPLVFGATRSKNGEGRLDYTPWAPATVHPLSTFTVTIPIIVLADNHSVSMAELTSMAIHTMPNGTIVGEHTWGANGALTQGVNYDDGQFYIGVDLGVNSNNFYSFGFVYTSSVEFQYLDGHIYEGKGFPPDHPVPYNPQALSLGDDPQLDTAISLIH
jgi:hypothetical protein